MSKQQTIEDCVGKESEFRYSFGFHYTHEVELRQWIHDNFKWYIVSYEISPTGLKHMQGYGERTCELTKLEKQVFQGRGRYAKYLNPDVKKKWWCTPARSNRYRNVMYVLKDVKKNHFEEAILSLNPCIDRDQMLLWIEESSQLQSEIAGMERERPTTFQHRMEVWYKEIPLYERPTKMLPLISRMLYDRVLPWQYNQDSRVIAAAEHLLFSPMNPDYHDMIKCKLAHLSEYFEKNNSYYM